MLAVPSYVLITPARNEAQFIERTINSVVAQTVRPAKWVIVSDGSTDGTDDIVAQYAKEHCWIELARTPDRAERHFAGKVQAFNTGKDRLKEVQYDLIGNLDADVEFDSNYFEFLLGKFTENPRLGAAGTPFKEGSFQYDYRFTSIEHVSGPLQMFRRECFEDIGGYIPRKIGGIDHVAVIMARMKGWQTRTFTDLTYIHHRQMGTASQGVLMAAWTGGRKDYLLGSNAFWELWRCIYQTTRPPVVIGGLLRFVGFTWLLARRVPRQVPEVLIAFRRQEQMQRLKALAARVLHLRAWS